MISKEIKGIYYIRNAINEYDAANVGYFDTLEEAKEALKDCSDWYCEKGTGTIYFIPFGLYQKAIKIFEGKGIFNEELKGTTYSIRKDMYIK